ncbi:hypothetical protein BJ138DRAFT_646787 [Hygrophoropsis aurantiaca]|uniref:Uncharacterized protein n=1 Tax=Hygrophoropsis aurantiaca TaxID=72124 RepID=A0ACB8AK45_9AGAM|nr:hypothetical protein BJ138DRAFT_646787 [Hygrophoropsis aurantiaca]
MFGLMLVAVLNSFLQPLPPPFTALIFAIILDDERILLVPQQNPSFISRSPTSIDIKLLPFKDLRRWIDHTSICEN